MRAIAIYLAIGGIFAFTCFLCAPKTELKDIKEECGGLAVIFIFFTAIWPIVILEAVLSWIFK